VNYAELSVRHHDDIWFGQKVDETSKDGVTVTLTLALELPDAGE
jgi:hypothetical protein